MPRVNTEKDAPFTRDAPLTKKCAFCDRKFSKTEHLKRHQRSHTGERPYPCTQCHKRFSRSDVLHRHIKYHAETALAAEDSATGARNSVVPGLEQREDSSVSISPSIIQNEAVVNVPAEDNLESSISSSQPSQIPQIVHKAITDPQSWDGSLKQPNGNIGRGEDARSADGPSNTFRGPTASGWNFWDYQLPRGHRGNIIEASNASNLNLSNNLHLQIVETQTIPKSHLQSCSSVLGQNILPRNQEDMMHQDLIGALYETSVLPEDTSQTRTENLQGSSNAPVEASNIWQDASIFDFDMSSGAFYMPISSTSPSDIYHIKEDESIPNERLARVQKCWPAHRVRLPRLITTLWHDMIFSMVGNLFSGQRMDNVSKAGGTQGLDEECYNRLRNAFHNDHQAVADNASPTTHNMAFTESQDRATSTAASSGEDGKSHRYHHFPAAEILNIGLDLYIRKFHPLLPFIHIPTFDPRSAPSTVLFAMCLIGLNILNTNESKGFVRQHFPAVLENISLELSSNSFTKTTTARQMSMFATAALTLMLSETMMDSRYQEKCHMLYISSLSVAQQQGLFTENDGQPLDLKIIDRLESVEDRWCAWSRVESAKRLITCLVMIDSWIAAGKHASPIIRTDALRLILPSEKSLFQARTATQWAQLLRTGRPLTPSAIELTFQDWSFPDVDCQLDTFAMHGLLSVIWLTISESYHRLLSRIDNRALGQHFVPWHSYSVDRRAAIIVSMVVGIIKRHGKGLQMMNQNCFMMWHHLCILLTADVPNFEVAAGSTGPDEARKALENIATWSSTPSARRACLHAAQVLRVASNRRASDGAMFHWATTLFTSGLVLGLYFVKAPKALPNKDATGYGSVDLLDEVDWSRIGDAGLVAGRTESALRDDPAVLFIENGGDIYISGELYEPGFESARRVLLDFIEALNDMGRWKLGRFSQILRIISDTLVDLDGGRGYD